MCMCVALHASRSPLPSPVKYMKGGGVPTAPKMFENMPRQWKLALVGRKEGRGEEEEGWGAWDDSDF